MLDDQGHALRLFLFQMRHEMLGKIVRELTQGFGHIVATRTAHAARSGFGVACELFPESSQKSVHFGKHALLVRVILLVFFLFNALVILVLIATTCLVFLWLFVRSSSSSNSSSSCRIVLGGPSDPSLRFGFQSGPNEFVFGVRMRFEYTPNDFESSRDAPFQKKNVLLLSLCWIGRSSRGRTITCTTRRHDLHQSIHIGFQRSQSTAQTVVEVDDLNQGAISKDFFATLGEHLFRVARDDGSAAAGAVGHCCWRRRCCALLLGTLFVWFRHYAARVHYKYDAVHTVAACGAASSAQRRAKRYVTSLVGLVLPVLPSHE